MSNLSCGKSLMRGTRGFICSFLQIKQSYKTFLISPWQASIETFLQIGTNVCSLPMWKLFSWHSFTTNFAIGWDLQIIIWLLEFGKSGWFILPPIQIKSFFTNGVSVKSKLLGVKIGRWSADYNHLGMIQTEKFIIKLIRLFQVLEMLVN